MDEGDKHPEREKEMDEGDKHPEKEKEMDEGDKEPEQPVLEGEEAAEKSPWQTQKKNG